METTGAKSTQENAHQTQPFLQMFSCLHPQDLDILRIHLLMTSKFMMQSTETSVVKNLFLKLHVIYSSLP